MRGLRLSHGCNPPSTLAEMATRGAALHRENVGSPTARSGAVLAVLRAWFRAGAPHSSFASLLLPSLICIPGCDDGGPRDDCTPIFQMTISPPESCLVVEPGTPTSFPTLSGTNDCTETFTVAPSPAIDAADGASLAFGAGKPFSVPISPTNPALPASNAPGTWTFPAALGSQSLTITVSRAPSDECP